MADSDSPRLFSVGTALGFLPVAAMQQARLRLGATSTPLPVGASEGEVGELSAPRERVLVLGDASALGAGCDEVEAALAPRLAYGVALRRRTRIHWTARGGAGWTAVRLDDDLRRRGVPPADAALLVIGVNDALAMTPLGAWKRQLDRIVARLFAAGVRLVAVSGLPPVQRLPGLVWPLAPLLALRAAQLDRVARRLAHPSPLAPERTIAYVPLPAIDPIAHVAADGMHASAAGYAWWAACAAEQLAREMDQLPAPPRTESFDRAAF